MQSVKEKLTFFCEHCDYVSTSKANLKKHSISHSTDLQTCGECTQQFASAKGLAQHKGKSHKAEKKESDEKEEIDPNGQVSTKSIEQEGVNLKKKKGSNKSKKDQSKKSSKQELIIQERDGLSVIKSPEPIHESRKTSVFDFWSDGEDDIKLMWSEETGRGIIKTTSREPPCHSRECQPCPHACCENIVVRTGLCCDPTTLGRCLQPYQAECYAPCCHHSVQLRDDYRWVGGELSKVERVTLVNPLEGESQLGYEVLKEYRQVNNNEGSVSEEESTSPGSPTDENYIPQIYSNQLISKYLDAKLGKVKPKSDFPVRNEFFKMYKDSSLPHGCRIVHKKKLQSPRIEFSYRSKCGKFFDTKAGLLSFVTNSESSKLDENVNTDLETSSKMFAEGLYQVVKHREGVKKDMMKCVKSYLREDEYDLPSESDKLPKLNEKSGTTLVSVADSQDFILQPRNKSGKGCDGTSKMSTSNMNDKIVSQSHHSRTHVFPNLTNPCNEKKSQKFSKAKSKGAVKTVFCEECNVTLSLGDMTKHIVVTHRGIEMRSCKICRSRLMNTKSFIKHNKEFHAEEGFFHEGVDRKGILRHDKINTTDEETSASISSTDQVLSEIGSNIVSSVNGNSAITSSSVFNDTFETLDEIENFVKSSARFTHPLKSTIPKSKRKSTTTGKDKLQVKSSLPLSQSTPSPIRVSNPKTKKGLVHEGKQVKRIRSLDIGLTSSTKKKLRKSLAESFADSEAPLKDTDPEHPTSSFNLRKKGRRNTKKTPMDTLLKSSRYKFILDTTRTINDVVEGEVLITHSAKPECYFRIGSKYQLKGKKPQKRIQPQNNLIQRS